MFSEALDSAEDQLKFLPFGGDEGQHVGQGQNQHGQMYGQHYTSLHQTGGQIQTPYEPRVKRASSPMTPRPGDGNGAGPSQGDHQQRQSLFESPRSRMGIRIDRWFREVSKSRSSKTAVSLIWVWRWTTVAIRFAYSGEQAGPSTATQKVCPDKSWIEHPQPR